MIGALLSELERDDLRNMITLTDMERPAKGTTQEEVVEMLAGHIADIFSGGDDSTELMEDILEGLEAAKGEAVEDENEELAATLGNLINLLTADEAETTPKSKDDEEEEVEGEDDPW